MKLSKNFTLQELIKSNTALRRGIDNTPSKEGILKLTFVKRGQMNNLAIYNTLIELDLDYDQCILEFGDSTATSDPASPAWIHLSWKVSDNRRQTLVAYKDANNKTKYRPLIKYNSI